MVLSKGAEPPGVRGSAPLGIWGVGEVYSGGSGDKSGAIGCVVCRVRVGLSISTGWGSRWRMGGRGQGNSMNSLGVLSSVGRAGSALGVLGMWLCAGDYAISVGLRAMHEVTM